MIYVPSTLEKVSDNASTADLFLVDDTMGYTHLVCSCQNFWMFKPADIPVCGHVYTYISRENDLVSTAHRDDMVLRRIAVPMLFDSCSLNAKVLAGMADDSGTFSVYSPVSPLVSRQGSYEMGMASSGEGRKVFKEMIYELMVGFMHLLFEADPEKVCANRSHPLRSFSLKKREDTFTLRSSPQDDDWANIVSLIQTGYCFACNLQQLYQLDPDPYERPFQL